MNIDEPANPVVASTGDPRDGVYCANGLTKREHAAISLRVPRSGDETIDAMIREAVRRDVAAKVLAGMVANPSGPIQANGMNGWALVNCTHEYVGQAAIFMADALLAELEKGAK